MVYFYVYLVRKREFFMLSTDLMIRKAVMSDLPAMTEIYNYEVTNGVATFDLEPKSVEDRKGWFSEHNVDNHPLYVAQVGSDVAGYASLSKYREKEAYKSTVELSIYISPAYRGKGIATALMGFILDEAKKDPTIHTVVSVITSGNSTSERLHEKFGFEFCGRIREVGFKHGRYLDISNYRLGV